MVFVPAMLAFINLDPPALLVIRSVQHVQLKAVQIVLHVQLVHSPLAGLLNAFRLVPPITFKLILLAIVISA